MYPLTTTQHYPRNQWWVAAYSAEVGEALMMREILGERVLLYRTKAGEAVAMSAICPHRAYPLEQGQRVGDAVQCGYHGFTFGPDGTCLRVPSQSGVPQKSSLRRYPVVETAGLVWVWTGDVDMASSAQLPDLGAMGLGRNDWAVEQHALVTINARYTLLIENLLDLSHVSFIHATTIPGGEMVASIPVSVEETAQSITVVRKGQNLPANPLIKMQFPGQEDPVNQDFDAEYISPALVRTGGAMSDAASGRPLGTQNYIHLITPASPTRVHYFVNTARDFAVNNPALGQMQIAMGAKIQPEDIAAIEAIELVLQSDATLPTEISARVDNGALKVRRRLEMQIKSEQATA